ncbi:MAG: hypothetical protein EOP11_20965, partial [Proteobacteria bacterium]
MIQAEGWRNQVFARNGGTMGTLPESVSVVASAKPMARAPAAAVDSLVAAVQAAPVAAPLLAPAAPIRPAVELNLPVNQHSVSRAEAPRAPASLVAVGKPRHATAIPYAAFYGPPTPPTIGNTLAKTAASTALESVSAAEVQGIIASLKDASGRVAAYPQKTRANALAPATITADATAKPAPAAPVQVAAMSGPGNEGLFMISGGQEEAAASTPLESVGMTKVAAGASWNIPGKITAPETLPKGHFEVGLFAKIDQDGIPIGFPLVQQILPMGVQKFDLRVPSTLEKGFLYGEFVATKTGQRTWIAPPVNPWLNTDRQVAELAYQSEDSVTTVAASVLSGMRANDSFKVSGTVATLFTKPGSPIPQEEVLVKVRGRKESTRTTKDGSFQLDLPKSKGTVYLEFLKPGYHPSVVAVNTDGDAFQVKVELASREAVEQVARMLGLRQITAKGVFMGRAQGADGAGLRNLSVQSSVKAEGPFYFNEDGFPSSDRKSTTADGRFIFFNVEPGA